MDEELMVVLAVVVVVMAVAPFFMKSIEVEMKKVYAGFWVALVVFALLSVVFAFWFAALVAIGGWGLWILHVETDRQKNGRG